MTTKGKTHAARVLIIDDDVFVTRAYGKMLRDRGFRVMTAHDGELGLEAVQKFHPDVVLLDLDLPKVNGIEWLKHIRATSENRRLPVIILTAGKVKSQISEAAASDATFVLSKAAVNPDIVVDAIVSASPEGVRVYT